MIYICHIMKQGMYIIAVLLCSIYSPCAFSQVTAPGAELTLVAEGFGFTEGPAVDSSGNVFFTDQPNNRIWRYSTEGDLAIFMEPAGRANGLYFDERGDLIACADEKSELWRITMDKQVKKLVVSYHDSLLNGPNDLWVAPDGTIYFTDPYYQRDYWERTAPDLTSEAVYMYRNGRVMRLDDQLKRPNGIVGTRDGKFLYVADINDGKTYRYTIGSDGFLSDKQLFANQGSDGMTIDNHGNLYLTGNGIHIYNSEGKNIEHIEVPAGWTANVCFGGVNRDVLFITASEKVFTLKMQVKGVH